MKTYLKLCRLAVRRGASNAALLNVGEASRRLAEVKRLLEEEKRTIESDQTWNRSQAREIRDRRMDKLNQELEQVIARQDLVAEEQARLQAAWESDVGTFTRLRDYLVRNPQLIPEGVPNDL